IHSRASSARAPRASSASMIANVRNRRGNTPTRASGTITAVVNTLANKGWREPRREWQRDTEAESITTTTKLKPNGALRQTASHLSNQVLGEHSCVSGVRRQDRGMRRLTTMKNNRLLGLLLAIALVALGVLAYLYYERAKTIAKIDVPGVSGEITKKGVDIEIGKPKN